MMPYSHVSFAGAASRALILSLVAMPLCGTAWAQAVPAGKAAPAPAPAVQAAVAPADPVVATVGTDQIRLSDLREVMASLPPNARSMPPQTLLPILLDQVIEARLLVAEARKQGLDKDATVARQMSAAADRALETALLHKEIDHLVTDAALKVRYEKDTAGKTGETEVHARHILVPEEAVAKKITEDLKKGGDFAALSKEFSKDPGASAQGGDLGFFKKGDMVPEFAATAFSLKDGEVSPAPVQTQFGWHVIQVLEHRQAPVPPYETARDELRQKVVQENVQAAVARARVGVAIEKFNLDGSKQRATDSAEPPPPAK